MTVLLFAFLAAASPSALPVRAVTVDGQTIEGRWAGSGGDGEIRIETGAEVKTLRLDDLLSVKWPSPASAPTSQPGTLQVHLKDGSYTPARLKSGNERELQLETPWHKHLVVPLAMLRAVRFGESSNQAASEAFEQALADDKADQDRLIVLRNERPAVLRGSLESLRPDGGSFRWRDRSIPVKPQETVAVVMAGASPAPAPAVCLMQDGSVWAGRIAGLKADSVRLQPGFGDALDLPVERISEIRLRSDRVQFLSDLTPAKYDFERLGAAHWPYRVNRSVTNRPMRIGDQSFDQGIGVHSRSVLTYDVPQGFRQVAATIGIDEAVGDQGNVIFRVLADGKEVFNSGPITGRDAPRPLLATIEDSRQIQLIVEFGDDLDIGDHADWAEVRLIK